MSVCGSGTYKNNLMASIVHVNCPLWIVDGAKVNRILGSDQEENQNAGVKKSTLS